MTSNLTFVVGIWVNKTCKTCKTPWACGWLENWKNFQNLVNLAWHVVFLETYKLYYDFDSRVSNSNRLSIFHFFDSLNSKGQNSLSPPSNQASVIYPHKLHNRSREKNWRVPTSVSFYNFGDSSFTDSGFCWIRVDQLEEFHLNRLSRWSIVSLL